MEVRYSHDQKERALNKTREHFANLGRGIGTVSEEEFERQFQYFLKILNQPLLPHYANKKITHPLDIEYFTDYPAPIMELVHSAHHTNLNSTISFFGPMLYYFARAIGAEQILEVGVAEGYTSWYLAHAVKDNATRYKMYGNMYYGVDILDRTEVVKPKLDAAGLPNTLIQMDSINLTSETFKDVRFDMIFLDGCHDRDHIRHEAEVLYPQLKGEGNGFMLLHDVYGPGEVGCHEVIKNPKYNWEYVRICEIYGIAILRKMDGYKEGLRWRE
jgi:predicted O-methyltransferase YrrM